MPISSLTCPTCGAPLLASKAGLATCAYCKSALTGVADASWDALLRTSEEDDASDVRPWCRVAGRKFLVRGLLAKGARCDVMFAERAEQSTELVIIKALRVESSAERFAGEWQLLARLGDSRVTGASFQTTLLPQPVVTGRLASRDGATEAAVYRWRSGFLYTLEDVRRAYPRGVDAQTAVWLWRRVLDQLAWLHQNGVRHGAVLPEHVLVHPRDHATVLVGWSHARPFLAAGADAKRDVQDSAKALLHVTGATLPRPLAEILEATADRGADDAGVVSRAVLEAATTVFGAPRYHPFTMPGPR